MHRHPTVTPPFPHLQLDHPLCWSTPLSHPTPLRPPCQVLCYVHQAICSGLCPDPTACAMPFCLTRDLTSVYVG